MKWQLEELIATEIQQAKKNEKEKRVRHINALKNSLKKDIEGPINKKIQNIQTAQKEDKGIITGLKNNEIKTLQDKIITMGKEEEQRDKEIRQLKEIIRQLREDVDSNAFTIGMAHFQREMKNVKAGWEEKKKTMEKRIIKWEWTDHIGFKFNGKYEGEVKGGVPHGLGKWEEDGGDWTVEGEWEDGLLNGRVVQNWYGDCF